MSRVVVVIGDCCVDLYWVGDIYGLSAEAPIPVVKQTHTLALPGMAANVAQLLSGLGGVQVDLMEPSPAHRPIKNRLVTSAGTQLARWDVEDYCWPLQPVDFHWDSGTYPDAIIVSDYGKGAVDQYVIGRVRTAAERGIPLYVDTKGDPYVWLGLPNCTLFPNSQEYLSWRSHYDWMPQVVHKMGPEGMEYMTYGKVVGGVAATARAVQNVCGAGDMVLAAYVHATLAGRDVEGAMAFATDQVGALVERKFNERYESNQSTSINSSEDTSASGYGVLGVAGPV